VETLCYAVTVARLSDDDQDFLKQAVDHADLQLFRKEDPAQALTAEQIKRRGILFGILVSLFERACRLVFEEDMAEQTRRLSESWEDDIRERCRRSGFRAALPELWRGEDAEFCKYIWRLAGEEAADRV
jgi:hypothetical protein